jgi:molybdopterin converting factor small subunit
MQEITPSQIEPSHYFKPFVPLCGNQYPVFTEYPSYVVEYQTKLRDKIREDEEDYIRRKRISDDINSLARELITDKEAWEAKEWRKNEVLDKWWQTVMGKSLSRYTLGLC